MTNIRITRLVVTQFDYEIVDMGLEETLGFDTVYRAGSRLPLTGSILTIETDAGVVGEAPGLQRPIDVPETALFVDSRHLDAIDRQKVLDERRTIEGVAHAQQARGRGHDGLTPAGAR